MNNDESVNDDYIVHSVIANHCIGYNSSDSRERILIVDDNTDIRRQLVNELSQERLNQGKHHPGFNALAVDDGDVALQLVRNGWAPSLILMDLMMPRLPGIVAIRKIRSYLETRSIPILAMMTGCAITRGHVPEADGLLQKPLHLETLFATAYFWTRRDDSRTDCQIPNKPLVCSD